MKFIFSFLAALLPLQIMSDSTAQSLYLQFQDAAWIDILKIVLSFLLALLSRFVYAWIDDYFKKRKHKHD